MSKYEFDLSLFTLGDYLEFLRLTTTSTHYDDIVEQIKAHQALMEFVSSFLVEGQLVLIEDVMGMMEEFTKQIGERLFP